MTLVVHRILKLDLRLITRITHTFSFEIFYNALFSNIKICRAFRKYTKKVKLEALISKIKKNRCWTTFPLNIFPISTLPRRKIPSPWQPALEGIGVGIGSYGVGIVCNQRLYTRRRLVYVETRVLCAHIGDRHLPAFLFSCESVLLNYRSAHHVWRRARQFLVLNILEVRKFCYIPGP